MKLDPFEHELSRQPLRAPPAEWRDSILRTANVGPEPSGREAPTRWWRDLVWPSPLPWAGLAAFWVAILALRLDTPPAPKLAGTKPAASTSRVSLGLVQQRAWLDQVLEVPASVPAPNPSMPRPRSERTRHSVVG